MTDMSKLKGYQQHPDDVVETDVPSILEAAAATFRERQKVYGSNYKRVGHALQALHPDGVQQNTAEDHELFHLWSLLVVKLSRFAVSNLTHVDSIHDATVYSAMIESILQEREQNKS